MPPLDSRQRVNLYDLLRKRDIVVSSRGRQARLIILAAQWHHEGTTKNHNFSTSPGFCRAFPPSWSRDNPVTCFLRGLLTGVRCHRRDADPITDISEGAQRLNRARLSARHNGLASSRPIRAVEHLSILLCCSWSGHRSGNCHRLTMRSTCRRRGPGLLACSHLFAAIRTTEWQCRDEERDRSDPIPDNGDACLPAARRRRPQTTGASCDKWQFQPVVHQSVPVGSRGIEIFSTAFSMCGHAIRQWMILNEKHRRGACIKGTPTTYPPPRFCSMRWPALWCRFPRNLRTRVGRPCRARTIRENDRRFH